MDITDHENKLHTKVNTFNSWAKTTERLALKALADIYPEKAEAYAIDFWNRKKYENNEYQKIMVLHVLHQIRSQKLCYYLEIAEHSEYKYLRMNAQEIREKIKADNCDN